MFNKKVFNVLIVTVSVLFCLAMPSAKADGLSYKDRPSEIQKKVDEVFNKLASDEESKWSENGKNKYYICRIDDEKLIMDIILSAPVEQKEFYFVDVGAGGYQWVDNVHKLIEKNISNLPPDKKYHIIGLNGEGKGEVTIKDNITIYKLGHFKIENMLEAFEERGMHLNGKVDLMVSRWTLRHLVDPLGTFLQMFELIKKDGYMLLEGIPFLRVKEGGDLIYGNSISDLSLNAEHLLRDMGQTYLVCPPNDSMGRGLRDLMIRKTEFYPEIEMSYYGLMDRGEKTSNVSRYMSKFLSKNPTRLKVKAEYENWEYNYHGDKTLYDMLKTKMLFDEYEEKYPSEFIADFILPAAPSSLESKLQSYVPKNCCAE
jgi:hypothetical protein